MKKSITNIELKSKLINSKPLNYNNYKNKRRRKKQ